MPSLGAWGYSCSSRRSNDVWVSRCRAPVAINQSQLMTKRILIEPDSQMQRHSFVSPLLITVYMAQRITLIRVVINRDVKHRQHTIGLASSAAARLH